MRQRTVLVIEPNATAAAYLQRTLSNAGYQVLHSATGKEGLIIAWRDQPDAIVLELDLPDIDGIEIVRRLRQDTRTQRLPIVSLTRRSSPEAASHARTAGVTAFLIKQPDAITLLLRLLSEKAGSPKPPSTQPERRGSILACLSAKGGVGTSVLCINLASQLAAQDQDAATAVVDLVLPLGSLMQYIGARPSIDVVHLTELEPSKLSASYLLRKLPRAKTWGFHLLPGAQDPLRAKSLIADRLSAVIQTIRSAFDTIVFDVGRNLSHLALMVLTQADALVMILSPDPISVNSTKVVMDYLIDAEEIYPERFFLLLNRTHQIEGLNVDSLEEALNRPLDGSLPNIGSIFDLANKHHAPLHVRFPEETMSILLRDIANKLQKRIEEDQRPPSIF